MDLQDQLKKLFPDHEPLEEKNHEGNTTDSIELQEDPILCKYEKRKGKPVTILEGYTGSDQDFKRLAALLKKQLSVGGSFKKDHVIIQGDYRNEIMEILQAKGFTVKRVGG